MKLARYGQRAGDWQIDLGIVVNLNLNLLVFKTFSFFYFAFTASAQPAHTTAVNAELLTCQSVLADSKTICTGQPPKLVAPAKYALQPW